MNKKLFLVFSLLVSMPNISVLAIENSSYLMNCDESSQCYLDNESGDCGNDDDDCCDWDSDCCCDCDEEDCCFRNKSLSDSDDAIILNKLPHLIGKIKNKKAKIKIKMNFKNITINCNPVEAAALVKLLQA